MNVRSIVATVLVIAGGVACSPTEPAGPTGDGVLILTGDRVTVVPGSRATFAVGSVSGPSISSTWLVNGIPGGNSSVGTISNGVYTAPGTFPPGDTVRISAQTIATESRTFSVRVYFVPALTPATDYTLMSPRVVDLAAPEPSRVLVVLAAGSTVRSITFAGAGQVNTPLADLGNGVHLLELPGATATAGYVVGALHNSLGSLLYKDAGGTTVKSVGFSVNVRDATAPAAPTIPVGSDAQAGRYVLNLRVDAPSLGTLTTAPVARALQLLGDRFDQIAVVSNVTSTNNRYHTSPRNSVQGIGLAISNNGASWGSASNLQGVNYFPIDTYFDAGEAGFNHEIGHQWVNFSTTTALAPGVPHWPASDMANYLMGFSIGGTGGQGGQFPYGLTALGNGQYRVDEKPVAGIYGPWDLYLMGLLPADSVPTTLIFPTTWAVGQTITPTPFTITQYIAAHGARSPSSLAAPRTFSVATVVLSAGRLLNATEMAFFEANAARAEATTGLPYSIGFANGTAIPFRLATGSRATLTTRID